MTKDSHKRIFRKCEVRHICLNNVEDLYDAADKIFIYAREQNRTYHNPAGNKVYFEFVGVEDFIIIGQECDDIEFWYDFVTRRHPMENKKKNTMDKSGFKKKIRQYLLDRKKKRRVSTSQSHKNISVDISYIENDISDVANEISHEL
ncbi:hypothetical protein FACS1894170_10040 [Planctomycetales bacterium]|nr:hypothetical protein FACS1894170_10040 [Planctomycetales bacterium]